MGAKLFENFLGPLRWTLHKPCTDLVQTLRSTLFKCCPPQIVADTCVLTSFPKMSKMKNHCTVLCIHHSWKIENQSTQHMIFYGDEILLCMKYACTYSTVLMKFFEITPQPITYFCDGDEILPCMKYAWYVTNSPRKRLWSLIALVVLTMVILWWSCRANHIKFWIFSATTKIQTHSVVAGKQCVHCSF